MTDLISLRAGDLALDLAPKVGGVVAGFRHGATDILRPMPAEAIARGLVRQSSCYPLVPYSNRIAHGRFNMDGQTHQLTLNFGDHPHSIHGNGWQRIWQVEAASETDATLMLDHVPFGFGPAGWDGWPFAFRAVQRFSLTPEAMEITMAIENRDTRPMPAGLGWHPYFKAHEGATLAFSADDVWRNGPNSLPQERVAIPPAWDYSADRLLGEPNLDNCFNGWMGAAEMQFPQEGLSVRMEAGPDVRHLVVYIPTGRGFFAVEPVTNMNDAVNRMDEVADHGLRILQPGEQMAISMSIAVTALAR